MIIMKICKIYNTVLSNQFLPDSVLFLEVLVSSDVLLGVVCWCVQILIEVHENDEMFCEDVFEDEDVTMSG